MHWDGLPSTGVKYFSLSIYTVQESILLNEDKEDCSWRVSRDANSNSPNISPRSCDWPFPTGTPGSRPLHLLCLLRPSSMIWMPNKRCILLMNLHFTYNVIQKMNELGFARHLTLKTMLGVSKNAFNGLMSVNVTDNYRQPSLYRHSIQRQNSLK